MIPLALEHLDDIAARARGRRLAVFLDYDGTLTPIAERPEQAVLSPAMRQALEQLSARCPVVIVSGRERRDVQRLVGLDHIAYAGAHGFDIAGPEGTEVRYAEGDSYIPDIRQAAEELERALAPIDGAIVEDKTYALAVHFRLVKPDAVDEIEAAVDAARARHPRLRKTGGKMILELRPDLDWDKGKAVLWLLEALDLADDNVLPFYLGDDLTDYDAFRALEGRGISLLVSQDPAAEGADYRLNDTEETRRFLEALSARGDR